MKTLLTLFAFLFGTWAMAHSGHPGAEDHGAWTHMAIGLFATLPVLAAMWGLIRLRSAKQARVEVKKESSNG